MLLSKKKQVFIHLLFDKGRILSLGALSKGINGIDYYVYLISN